MNGVQRSRTPEGVKEILEDFPWSSHVSIKEALLLLWRLARDSDKKEVKSFLRALDRLKWNDKEIQHRALTILATLAAKHPSKRLRLWKVSHSQVRRWVEEGDPNVWKTACIFVRNLATNGGIAEAECISEMWEAVLKKIFNSYAGMKEKDRGLLSWIWLATARLFSLDRKQGVDNGVRLGDWKRWVSFSFKTREGCDDADVSLVKALAEILVGTERIPFADDSRPGGLTWPFVWTLDTPQVLDFVLNAMEREGKAWLPGCKVLYALAIRGSPHLDLEASTKAEEEGSVPEGLSLPERTYLCTNQIILLLDPEEELCAIAWETLATLNFGQKEEEKEKEEEEEEEEEEVGKRRRKGKKKKRKEKAEEVEKQVEEEEFVRFIRGLDDPISTAQLTVRNKLYLRYATSGDETMEGLDPTGEWKDQWRLCRACDRDQIDRTLKSFLKKKKATERSKELALRTLYNPKTCKPGKLPRLLEVSGRLVHARPLRVAIEIVRELLYRDCLLIDTENRGSYKDYCQKAFMLVMKAMKLHPNDDLLLRSGCAALSSFGDGMEDEILKALEKVINDHPHHPQALMRVWRSMEKDPPTWWCLKRLESLKSLLEKDPGNRMLHEELLIYDHEPVTKATFDLVKYVQDFLRSKGSEEDNDHFNNLIGWSSGIIRLINGEEATSKYPILEKILQDIETNRGDAPRHLSSLILFWSLSSEETTECIEMSFKCIQRVMTLHPFEPKIHLEARKTLSQILDKVECC
jgi:hypothetical protein